MNPEQFAMHATPINKSSVYTVYRPNQGYKNDRTYERCEEYDNVLLAITQVNRQLAELKKAYEQQSKPLTEQELVQLTVQYEAQRQPLAKRFAYLENQRKSIKEKYGIINKYGETPEFTQLLLDELYRVIEPERFEAAVRVAKQKFAELTQK